MSAAFKIRRNALFMERIRVGSSGSYTQIADDGDITQVGTAAASLNQLAMSGGTSLCSILCGSAQIATPTPAAYAASSASVAGISGLTTSHKVFVSGCVSACVLAVQGAEAASAEEIRIWYLNAASAGTPTASTLTFNYLALRDA